MAKIYFNFTTSTAYLLAHDNEIVIFRLGTKDDAAIPYTEGRLLDPDSLEVIIKKVLINQLRFIDKLFKREAIVAIYDFTSDLERRALTKIMYNLGFDEVSFLTKGNLFDRVIKQNNKFISDYQLIHLESDLAYIVRKTAERVELRTEIINISKTIGKNDDYLENTMILIANMIKDNSAELPTFFATQSTHQLEMLEILIDKTIRPISLIPDSEKNLLQIMQSLNS